MESPIADFPSPMPAGGEDPEELDQEGLEGTTAAPLLTNPPCTHGATQEKDNHPKVPLLQDCRGATGGHLS